MSATPRRSRPGRDGRGGRDIGHRTSGSREVEAAHVAADQVSGQPRCGHGAVGQHVGPVGHGEGGVGALFGEHDGRCRRR